MTKEFDLIKRYFNTQNTQRSDVILGIGDDAAILEVPAGQQCIYSCDTLVSGRHFAIDAPPQTIGHKALAVSLSDCAAMGATPAWVSLALTLPTVDDQWLQQFCAGFFALLTASNATLIGGDLSQGPLSITVSVHGLVPRGTALTRSGAQPGDGIYVTGCLGGAGLAYLTQQQSPQPHYHVTQVDYLELLALLQTPQPRLAQGFVLRGLASAAVDISDGLAADLGHILEHSHCSAQINLADIPIHPIVNKQLSSRQACKVAMTAGDDYELCFCMPEKYLDVLQQRWQPEWIPYHRIGSITAHVQKTQDSIQTTTTGEQTQLTELLLQWPNGEVLQLDQFGYQHFS